MTSLEFATKLNSINKKSEILEAIYTFINNFSEQYDKNEISFFIETISDDKFTSFGNKLGFCRNHCIEELKKIDNEKEQGYLQSLRKVENLLFEFSTIYQDVVTKRKEAKEAKENSNVNYAVHQNAAVLKEVNAKVSQFRQDLKEAKKDIAKANNSIDEATKNIDNKIFSVLINTVAILGIFVAIAFTGLGSMSIFSSIDLEIALQSNKAFITNIFFVLLTGTLVYNLLIVLVYFIFKLSRPLSTIKLNNDKSICTFWNDVKLLPFIIADATLALLTVISFAATFFVC